MEIMDVEHISQWFIEKSEEKYFFENLRMDLLTAVNIEVNDDNNTIVVK